MTDTLLQNLLHGYYKDADDMQRQGIASAADIDTAMRLGAGYPAGPFEARGVGATAQPAVRALPARRWESAAVIGTGRMATGIAEAIAKSGSSVAVVGRSVESADRARATITQSLARSVQKGRLDAQGAVTIQSRVTYAASVPETPNVDVVIEAVAEHLATKQDVLAELDALLASDVAFATNTSSFRVSEVMQRVAQRRPVLALHFFNPAQVMKLVEVVAGDPTDTETLAIARAWVGDLGKISVICADTRGFVVNRLLIPYLNDAVRLHESGVSVATLEQTVIAAGLPMGPFALIDMIGIDVIAAALAAMAEANPDPRLQPTATLIRMIEEGRLGAKSGSGFTSTPYAPAKGTTA